MDFDGNDSIEVESVFEFGKNSAFSINVSFLLLTWNSFEKLERLWL